jgi:hypothetical protein
MKTIPQSKYDFFGVIQAYLDEASQVDRLTRLHSRQSSASRRTRSSSTSPCGWMSGEIRLFKGYRVQHNNLLGPYKGGIRYHESRLARRRQGARRDDDVEVRAHEPAPTAAARAASSSTRTKSRATSCSGSPGGSSTRWATTSAPRPTSPPPTSAPTRSTMAWAMDTYMNTVGHLGRQAVKGVVTGKPVAWGHPRPREGDRPGPRALHRNGPKTRLQARRRDPDRAGLRQRRLARALILSRLGVSTIAVGDHSGYLYNPRASTRTSCRSTSRSTARSPATRRQADQPRGVLQDQGGHLRAVPRSKIKSASRRQSRCRSPRRRGRQWSAAPPRARKSCSTAASTSCPTSSRTRAASRSATTSGRRTSAARAWTLEEVDETARAPCASLPRGRPTWRGRRSARCASPPTRCALQRIAPGVRRARDLPLTVAAWPTWARGAAVAVTPRA